MQSEKEVIEFCVKTMKMLFESRLTTIKIDTCTLNEVLENISDDDVDDAYSCIEAGYKRGYIDLLKDLNNLLDCDFLQENFDEYMKK